MRLTRCAMCLTVAGSIIALLSGCQKEAPVSSVEAPKTRVRTIAEQQTSATRTNSKSKAGDVTRAAQKKNSETGSQAPSEDSADDFASSGPRVAVTGKVMLPDGKPAVGASLQLSGYEYNEDTGESSTPIVAETSSTAEGKFKLAGRGLRGHTVRAQLQGYATVQVGLQEKNNRAWDAELPPMRKFTQDVRLAERAILRGHVIDDKDSPVAGASVTFSAGNSSGQPGTKNGYAAQGITTTSVTGDFVLEDIAAGERLLTIDSKKHVPLSQNVTAPTSDVLVLRLQTSGAVVTGHAYLKTTGEALSSVTVGLNFVPKDYPKGPRYAGFKEVSDSSGAFEITCLPAGKYKLEAIDMDRGLGLVPSPDGNRQIEIADKETTQIDVFLYAGHAVSGVVLDKETSTPIEGAKLTASSASTGRGRKKNSTVTGADGSYRMTGLLPSGGAQVTLVVQKSGYKIADRNNGENVWVKVDPDDLEAHKDVMMLKSVNVTGTIKTKDGVPVPGAKVSVFDRNGGWGRDTGTPAGKDGKYVLEANRYTMLRIKAEAPNYPAAFSDPVQIEDKTVENVDVVLEPGGTVAGTVVDPVGQPIEGADVTSNQEVRLGNMSSSTDSGKAKTDAAGAFLISNVPKEFTLSASKEKFARSKPETVQVDPAGAKSGVVLKLQVPHFIAGKVSNPAGDPIKDVQIQASDQSGSGGTGSARSDEKGQYKLENLPEGSYYMYAWRPNGGGSTPNKQGVKVDRSDVDFVFGDREGVTLIGTVVDEKTGAAIKDFTSNGSGFKKDKTPGHFTYTGLTAGSTNEIELQVTGWPTAKFDVPVPKDQPTFEHEFKMGAGGNISGRVIAKDGAKPMPGVKIMLWGSLNSWERQQSMPLALATTDENGKFTVGPGPAGKNSLTIKPESPLVALNKDAQVKNYENTDMGDIVLGGGCTVRVRVVRGSQETPVPDIALELREQTDYESSKSGKTGADGVYTFSAISPGRYNVSALKPTTSSYIEVKEDETKEVVIRFGGGKLIGHVLKGGQPVAATVNIGNGNSADNQNRYMQTDADGSFTFEDLAAGSCDVSLNLMEDYNVRISEKVDITEGAAVEKTFTFPNGGVTGIVTDSAGTAVMGAHVSIAPSSTSHPFPIPSGNVVQPATTSVKGEFSFNGLKPGTYTLTATHSSKGLAMQSGVQVGDNGQTNVTLKLELGGGIVESVALDLADGKPIQSAWCYLNGPSGILDHGATRGADGIMKINNVPPGTYQVQVGAWSYSTSEKSIEVKAGETTHIDDVLYAAGVLRWTLKDKSGKALDGVPCHVTPSDANSVEIPRDGTTDSHGICTVRGLAPGNYTATALPAGHAPATQLFTIKAASIDDKATVVE